MKKKRTVLSLLLMIVIVMTLPFSALAVDGDGDGSGGGTDEPLALESSSIPDGSTGIALDVTITLTFTKNVVNMSVKDSNMTCFSMKDSNGNTVPIDILMGDDQVDPDIKRIVEISPKNDLSPGTKYTLTISKNLTSKSGVSLGSDIKITFTTVNETASTSTPKPTATAAPTPAPTSTPESTTTDSETTAEDVLPSDDATPTDDAGETEDPASSDDAQTVVSTETDSPDTTDGSSSAANGKEGEFPWYVPVAVLIVIGVGGGSYAYYRRKK